MTVGSGLFGNGVDVGTGGGTTRVSVAIACVGDDSTGGVGKPGGVAVATIRVRMTRGAAVNPIAVSVAIAVSSASDVFSTIIGGVGVGSRIRGSSIRLIVRPELFMTSGSGGASSVSIANSGALIAVALGRLASISCPRPGMTMITRKTTTASDAAIAKIIGL